LNSSELFENAQKIVAVDPIQKTIKVKEKSTLKPFGPFDKVYDQEATQSQIYIDVVAPLIGQVLEGYNCTVFAYGQTGAGKTYTMEGRHEDSGNYTWENDPTAGIIPRALHHIFTKLENESSEDYSVKASYVELYNEQVYDLLSAGNQSLRVFDNKDKGVTILGMEELLVRNRAEVYALLKKGADRRKTASTLMNITSSRSHSVFTLTVTTRQTVANEELLRIGKIHLVDLAGSESVGKSGAVNQRAREAGNINTSLLALGRVINALTSNASHIPYRESKLTRILQHSIGGNTITTIIAALSPASTNYEETANTLEYVQRAKNIKNTPTENTQLTKKHVLLAYNEEVARLQCDLVSIRCGSEKRSFVNSLPAPPAIRLCGPDDTQSILKLREFFSFTEKSILECDQEIARLQHSLIGASCDSGFHVGNKDYDVMKALPKVLKRLPEPPTIRLRGPNDTQSITQLRQFFMSSDQALKEYDREVAAIIQRDLDGSSFAKKKLDIQ